MKTRELSYRIKYSLSLTICFCVNLTAQTLTRVLNERNNNNKDRIITGPTVSMIRASYKTQSNTHFAYTTTTACCSLSPTTSACMKQLLCRHDSLSWRQTVTRVTSFTHARYIYCAMWQLQVEPPRRWNKEWKQTCYVCGHMPQYDQRSELI